MRLMVTLLVLIFSFQIFAAESEDDFWESRSTKKSSSSRRSSIALGLASNSQLLQRSETAISGLFSIGSKSEIQGFFMLPSSDPNLYSVGALFKYIVSGRKKLGFHVGGGLGLGEYADNRDFTRIMANAGFRLTVQKKIQIHVDAGLTIQDDDPNNSQTTIQGNSAVYGLSLLYKL